MNTPDNIQWIESNQQALSEELGWIHQLLENAASESATADISRPDISSYTLDFLAEQFQLSSFERTIILLCAGMEMQSDFSMLLSKAQGNMHLNYPSFSLALAILPDAHWSALTPESPLRYWHLVNVNDHDSITTAQLSLDERILHFLLGTGSQDQRLTSLVRPVGQSNSLPPSQLRHTEHLANLWRDNIKPPVILIQGNDTTGGRDVAAHTCSLLKLHPLLIRAEDIPVAADERSMLTRLLNREFLLSRAALLIDAEDNPPSHPTPFIDQLACPLILLGEQPVSLQRNSAVIEVNKPTAEEQGDLWRKVMDATDGINDDELASLVTQFNFSANDIAATAAIVQAEVNSESSLKQTLWQHCREHSRGGLEHLSQRIKPRADWDDLVLPGGQKSILHDISRQVRYRHTVYESWGFSGKSERGLGISALFAGESGTGKTMAAEVLAADLKLDLYRIDLSSVVSKYIGETEKNLERLFRAAETSGAILLFDEADALFGKRSEVKDSHDRYANIELAYLLQRMESYRGLSILTSNMRTALDTAFLRRIRFVVQFPFPDVAQRDEIWQRIFPGNLPHTDLKTEQLARLNVTGGNIRNIAMNAAFIAAENGDPLSMSDLAHAARLEYAKLEKPFNDSELRKWT